MIQGSSTNFGTLLFGYVTIRGAPLLGYYRTSVVVALGRSSVSTARYHSGKTKPLTYEYADPGTEGTVFIGNDGGKMLPKRIRCGLFSLCTG